MDESIKVYLKSIFCDHMVRSHRYLTATMIHEYFNAYAGVIERSGLYGSVFSGIDKCDGD